MTNENSYSKMFPWKKGLNQIPLEEAATYIGKDK